MKRKGFRFFALSLVTALLLVGCTTTTQPAVDTSAPAAEPAKAPDPAPAPAPVAWKPTKPVEMTVLFGAGSAADLIARTLADGMSKELNQSVPVVNRTGGGGAVGYTHVKAQAADGYAIVWNSNSISTAYYAGNMKMTHEDFEAVARVSVETSAIAVKAGGFKTLAELVDFAKANPGKVKIGNSGVGSYTHLTAVAFAKAADIQVIHVPFGQGLAVSNLLGGQIEASVQLPAEVMSQFQNDQVWILGVTSDAREPNLPNVPTLKEQNLDVVLDLWRGIAVPKGTSPEVIASLEAAIKVVVESPAFQEQGKKLIYRPAFLSAAEFRQLIAEDDKRIAAIMTELGLNKAN